LLHQFHYLSYRSPVGENLEYWVRERTPREASRSEEDRPKLIEVMKVALYEIVRRSLWPEPPMVDP
jgi:hypothetical protein